MKRLGYLYEQIIDVENLKLASQKAQKGKKHHADIMSWNTNIEQNILGLHKDLKDKTYKVPEYSIFTIYEPKERVISKLPFRDRVVHHAILNILEKPLTNSFISQTYSCIKKRGIHKCLKDLTGALKTRPKYCLKLDIKKFYPSLDHEVLKLQLKRKFKDPNLLWLLSQIIESSPDVPLGNYTSQWFSNFYLNNFDHWIKQTKKIKYYFRYCDDMVILGEDKKELQALLEDIKFFLGQIKLELSNHQIFPIESRGVNFVGYKSYYSHILLRKSIKERMKRMIRLYPNKKSIVSYFGWAIHANCRNLENKYLSSCSSAG